ncbi:hypothetical protein FOA52_008516 [Chlamydomonas sp. UWO 241]|nr:hypothetical protein FOA52_008516 [Chlamydomonas sp. UWO 241]
MPPVRSPLFLALVETDKTVGAISEDAASAFFGQFSLQDLFSEFASPALSDADLWLATSVLSRLLHTRTGSALLPGALPYLESASDSPRPLLRKLAVKQYGALLAGGGVDGVEEAALAQLAEALGDIDTGVSSDAEAVLVAWAARGPARAARLLGYVTGAGDGDRVAGALRAMADGADATHRMRVLSLLVGVGTRGGGGAAVARSGALQALLTRELSSAPSDPLSALSALTMVSEMAQAWVSPPGGSRGGRDQGGAGAGGTGGSGGDCAVAGALAAAVAGPLPALVGEAALRPVALRCAALLLRTALDESGAGGSGGGEPMDVDSSGGGGGGAEALSGALMVAIFTQLDEAGDASAEDEAATLDAVAELCHSRAGAMLLLSHATLPGLVAQRAFGRTTPSPDVRLAACHALASLSGVERAHDWHEAAAAALPAAAEAALRAAVYSGVAAGGAAARTPADALASVLSLPWPEQRAAAYRAASGLALRPWYASELARR